MVVLYPASSYLPYCYMYLTILFNQGRVIYIHAFEFQCAVTVEKEKRFVRFVGERRGTKATGFFLALNLLAFIHIKCQCVVE